MSVISEEELREIVEVVWMTVLGMPALEGDFTDMPARNCLSASIDITGALQGKVLVRASVEFLSIAASLMFDCALGEISDLDRRDTLTELTNMLGGSVKCVLPECCDLGLPMFVDEGMVDAKEEWVGFSCNGMPLVVAVTQNSEQERSVA